MPPHTRPMSTAPLPADSDAESIADEIPHTAPESKEEPTDTKMNDGDDEEEEEEEEDGETYVVEAIKDHRSDFEDGQMRYHVKWKGYEKKADRTWETEENLDGARELLEEYWRSLPGGKPVPAPLEPTPAPPKSAKKRGRQSTGSKQPEPTKRTKTSRAGRKSNGALEQDTTPSDFGKIGYMEVGDDDWKPPQPQDGSWDPLVQQIDTVMREGEDGALWGYIIWNHKNEDGRFYRSKAKLPTIYRACPQRMLDFYEKHLVFSVSTEGVAPDADEKPAEQ